MFRFVEERRVRFQAGEDELKTTEGIVGLHLEYCVGVRRSLINGRENPKGGTAIGTFVRWDDEKT